ncbi:MAG: hypothetical protein IJ433_03960 [Ruminococcus sp.]|nr:hypothetical protein [Ruminococcus sp.]
MRATITIMLVSIIMLSSVIGVSATISHTTGHDSYYSLNHIDDNYASTDINLKETINNNDYYSGGEWTLAFANDK